MDRIIVSRHLAAIEFVARELGGRLPSGGSGDSVLIPDASGNFCGEKIPVIASATAADVRGRIVYGNVPLHLAALAAKVVAIQFRGDAPRGAEYGLAEMGAAGAYLASYRVVSL